MSAITSQGPNAGHSYPVAGAPGRGDGRPRSFLARGKREKERERERERDRVGGQVVKSCPSILNAVR
jgi:hypothetical protein